ncbi:hypothetical protein [Pseudoxanthomonas suwonensis]|uniref:Uncharacterized protein n=1 Tax=Pseudoxanthomonas suwonensis TaxID=314722 RepID=A0A0E3UPB6_9GAMM|nr:hypothetical protein [Pseudoxanthomonas suwonensis]AKC87670.1 hypothetical protein WQ53_13810 [Pseudoxanthomonas suwonensis]
MESRLLVVRKDHRGCTLFDGGRPLAWYSSLDAALELARMLADASALRDGPPARVEIQRFGPPPRERSGPR